MRETLYNCQAAVLALKVYGPYTGPAILVTQSGSKLKLLYREVFRSQKIEYLTLLCVQRAITRARFDSYKIPRKIITPAI